MPVSVIEAMSLGLAVVSTDVGGIPFLLENEKDSLLIPDGDVDQMVEAIVRLQEDPILFNGIVSTARNKSKQFEWPQVKAKWLDLLQ
jgi:glycosyltransferase involved in cell wall biosynthesis